MKEQHDHPDRNGGKRKDYDADQPDFRSRGFARLCASDATVSVPAIPLVEFSSSPMALSGKPAVRTSVTRAMKRYPRLGMVSI